MYLFFFLFFQACISLSFFLFLTLACISLFFPFLSSMYISLFFSFLSIFLSFSSDCLFHVVRDTNYNGINKKNITACKTARQTIIGCKLCKKGKEDPRPEGIWGIQGGETESSICIFHHLLLFANILTSGLFHLQYFTLWQPTW